MDATKPLNEYDARELEILQVCLAIAYEANSNLNGKDATSNLLIARWADRVAEAIREVKAETLLKSN